MTSRIQTIATRRFVAWAAVAALCSLGACAVAPPAPYPAQARVVYRDMPVPMVEVVPVAPASGYHWVPGHWVWREGAWRWNAGHYVQAVVPPMPPLIVEPVIAAPSGAHVYVRGHWRWGGTGWGWVHGTWVAG